MKPSPQVPSVIFFWFLACLARLLKCAQTPGTCGKHMRLNPRGDKTVDKTYACGPPVISPGLGVSLADHPGTNAPEPATYQQPRSSGWSHESELGFLTLCSRSVDESDVCFSCPTP